MRSRSTRLSSTTRTVRRGVISRKLDDPPVVVEQADEAHELLTDLALEDVAGHVEVVRRRSILVALGGREHEDHGVVQLGILPQPAQQLDPVHAWKVEI